jgi:hypothetical protein
MGRMGSIIEYKTILSSIYECNKLQINGMARRGGEMLDAGFGSIQQVFNGRFSEMLRSL